MNAEGVLTGGGIAGLVVALAYLGRLMLDARREKRSGPLEQGSAHVATAEAANAVLVRTLEGLQVENTRLQTRVKHLEESEAEKDRKIDELEERLNDIAAELSQLKGR